MTKLMALFLIFLPLSAVSETTQIPDSTAAALLQANDDLNHQVDWFETNCVGFDNKVISTLIVWPEHGLMNCLDIRLQLKKRYEALEDLQRRIKAAKTEEIPVEGAVCKLDGACSEPMSEEQLSSLDDAKTVAAATPEEVPVCSEERKTKVFSKQCFSDLMENNAYGTAWASIKMLAPDLRVKIPVSGSGSAADGRQEQSACATELFGRFTNALIADLTVYKNIAVMAGKWVVKKILPKDQMRKIETASTDANLIAAQTPESETEEPHQSFGRPQIKHLNDGKSFLKEMTTNPAEYIQNWISDFLTDLGTDIKYIYGCEKWDGNPLDEKSTCIAPMSGWDCASCSQRLNIACGLLGTLAEDAVDVMISMFIFEGATTAGKWILKKTAGRAALALNRIAIRALPGIGTFEKGVASRSMALARGAKLGLRAGTQGAKAGLRRVAGDAVLRAAAVMEKNLARMQATRVGRIILKGALPVAKYSGAALKKGGVLIYKGMTSNLNPIVAWLNLCKAGTDSFKALSNLATGMKSEKMMAVIAEDAAKSAVGPNTAPQIVSALKEAGDVKVMVPAQAMGEQCSNAAASGLKADVKISSPTQVKIKVPGNSMCRAVEIELGEPEPSLKPEVPANENGFVLSEPHLVKVLKQREGLIARLAPEDRETIRQIEKAQMDEEFRKRVFSEKFGQMSEDELDQAIERAIVECAEGL